MNSKKPLFLFKNGGSLKFCSFFWEGLRSSWGRKGGFSFFSSKVLTLSLLSPCRCTNERGTKSKTRVNEAQASKGDLARSHEDFIGQGEGTSGLDRVFISMFVLESRDYPHK